MAKDIFKNQQAWERQEEWYQRFLVRAGQKVEFHTVDTSFGENHILTAGDAENPPLVCLHAMLTSSAHLLSEIRGLAEHYHLIMPDIPGHSVRGIPLRLPYTDDSHARWLKEVLDELNLDNVDLFGVSLGGFIARQFASAWPERVEHLVLVVPAGIVQGSVVKGLMQMAVPMVKYKISPTEENLKQIVNFLLTNWDEDWAYYLGDSMNDFKTLRKIPPVASDEELEDLTMPCLIIAADEDISFPGKPLIERVQSKIPWVETELLEARHSPPTTDEFRSWMADRIQRFLADVK